MNGAGVKAPSVMNLCVMGHSTSLADNITKTPTPFDRDAVVRLRDAWGAKWAQLGENEQRLIEGVAGCSPYLRRIMSRAPETVVEILHNPPSEYLAKICGDIQNAAQTVDVNDVMSVMRKAKRKAALSIALADISGATGTMEAAEAVSMFADCAVDAAMTASARKLKMTDGCAGLCAIAMGKLGAFELNYSSDIDLIMIYDPSAMGLDGPTAKAQAVQLTREVVAFLQNQTADGYVFRTDLRLRPDPGVSAVAVSVQAAEAYYESFGQNWERMAFIKARAHAGDIEVGEKFLKALRPFVWRKFLDFAAIEDVKAVKRQIHYSKGGGAIDFAGHDIKTGRGGIREIEFFAQTQQLILGGKDKDLRLRSTLDALSALRTHGHIEADEDDDLHGAYIYLRHVEHRLQMINDEQTHQVPKSAHDIERVAMFAGEADSDSFEDRLTSTLETVQRRFDALFHDDSADVEQPGPLVFTGVDGDPATLNTLNELGFIRAAEISAVIRRWHTGSIRATRTERARNILTKLMAPLLIALSRSSDPDAAFFAFDKFLSSLPAGVQIFSLLANNIALFDTLIEIIVMSPFLGQEMSRRVNFIETLLEQGLSTPLPAIETYESSVAEELEVSANYEETLNIIRRWAGEAKFTLAAKLAVGHEPPTVAAAHLTAIAETCVRALTPAVAAEMNAQHGVMDGALAVIALGRFGANEMTVASDIDLMFVYDAPVGAFSSPDQDGARSLDAVSYYTRFVRRLVTALSVATEEGGLYEVDMALRPSGSAGPAAVKYSAFQRYYADDAWTWEIMSLTKARVIAGDKVLAKKVDEEVNSILRRPRNRDSVAQDVNEMRARLLAAKPGSGPWDVKHVLGGLTDIAFIAQYLVLISADEHGRPPCDTQAILAWLGGRNVVDQDIVEELTAAQALFDQILHLTRTATGAGFDPASAGAALRRRIAKICGASSFEAAEEGVLSLQGRVAQLYRQVVGKLSEAVG